MALQTLVLAALTVWLLALTVAFFILLRFFRKLVKGVKDYDLRSVLEKILDYEVEVKKRVDLLEKEATKIEDEGKAHVQKIGLVRFNPFKEIGGDHSFSLALLDGKDTGVIVTGLHTRERTRVYMKAIKGGKCEYELSDEEKRALVKAQKGK
jgi:hypothetical protein